MNNIKRKPFFIKGNFLAAFIAGFVLLLLIEVVLSGLSIYWLAGQEIEKQLFSSHINIAQSAKIISPIIIKVNASAALLSVLLACLALLIVHLKTNALFSKIVEGLHNIKDKHTYFRIRPFGANKSRQLIEEFNLAASYFDKQLNEINSLLDSLIACKDSLEAAKLRQKLHSLIAGKNPV